MAVRVVEIAVTFAVFGGHLDEVHILYIARNRGLRDRKPVRTQHFDQLLLSADGMFPDYIQNLKLPCASSHNPSYAVVPHLFILLSNFS